MDEDERDKLASEIDDLSCNFTEGQVDDWIQQIKYGDTYGLSK